MTIEDYPVSTVECHFYSYVSCFRTGLFAMSIVCLINDALQDMTKQKDNAIQTIFLCTTYSHHLTFLIC